MTLTPLSATVLTAVILALSAPVTAQTRLTPLQASVASEMRNYGFRDVDVTQISTVKLAHISHLLHSDKSPAQIRGNIGAVLGDSVTRSVFGRRR